jgi:hypothetical protein
MTTEISNNYTFNWILETIEAIPELNLPAGQLSDVVNIIYWTLEIHAHDDHSIEYLKGNTTLNINGVNPDGFTHFLELTQEQLISWIQDDAGGPGVLEQMLIDRLENNRRDWLPTESRPVTPPWMQECCSDGTGFHGGTGTQP